MPQEFEFAGTVSHATLRDEDLIPTFMKALKEIDPTRYVKFLEDWIVQEVSFPEEPLPLSEHTEELFDALNINAPAGYYFGAHPGDGSDFGFWEIEDHE